MENSIVLESVFVKLRHSITRLRSNTLRDIFLAFKKIDVNGNGVVTDDAFETALNDCGLFLTKSEMWQMKRHFGQDSGLNCMKIFYCIREELNEGRKAFITNLYNTLSNGADSLSIEAIFEKYNASKNPRVLSGMISAVRSISHFKASFKQYPSEISLEDFIDAFTNIGAYYLDDTLFASVICECFEISNSKSIQERNPMAEVRSFLEEKLRQRSRGNESFLQTLTRVFKFFDMDANGTISYSEFSKVFERLGLLLTDDTLKALWDKSDVNQDGKVNFKEWSKLILGRE